MVNLQENSRASLRRQTIDEQEQGKRKETMDWGAPISLAAMALAYARTLCLATASSRLCAPYPKGRHLAFLYFTPGNRLIRTHTRVQAYVSHSASILFHRLEFKGYLPEMNSVKLIIT